MASQIANKRIGAIRAERALAVPCVVVVMTHLNAPRPDEARFTDGITT